MPETIEAPAPASSGIDAMVDAKFAPPAPAATPTPAPETPPATPPETPPATLNIEAAPNAKPKTGFDSLEKDWTPELEAKLRKLYPEHKMWRVKDVVESKYKSSESQLTAKLAELEARRQTPANDEKIEQLQKLIEDRDQRLKERDQRLEEADFTLGQTYAKFVSRFNTEKLEALDVVKSLAVTYTDPEGETKTRQATDSDFNQALNISDPAAQDDFIEKTFGRSAWRVTNHINELNRIRRDAKQAKDDFAANFEKNKVERELAAKRQEQEYEGHFNEAFKGLSSDPDLGSYVSESEADPEGTALLKAELNKFDSFKTEMAKMNPKDRAGAVALVRARFGGAPRAIAELKKERAKSAELEAKIAKLIGTDPGQQVKTVTGGPAATEAKGIEGMVGALKWDGSK